MKRVLPSIRLLSVLLSLMCLPACSGDEPQPSDPGGGGGESAGGNGGAAAEAVDLGLSVRWAACNMGASAPHEAGGLYGWADPTGQAVTDQVHDEAYNWTSPLYGGADPVPDICRTIYDLPHMSLGGCWRLPSEAEARELVERCVWREETRQGVKGYTVTGPNGRSIFLPMAGMRVGAEPYEQGRRGYYWTGTRQPGATGAVSLHVGGSTGGQISSDYRYQGCSVRPVLGTDSTTFTYDSPLDTVDRRVDMGVLSDSGKPLYWASGNLVVRRYARAYIAHDPTFVPEHRIFSEEALEWDCFSWGDAMGRVQHLSPEWEALDPDALPENISGDARYDIARAQLGGNWRLPTASEWQQLIDNCTLTYTNEPGHFRIWLTSNTTGNVLCFDDIGVPYYISPGTLSISKTRMEYLSGNKKEIVKLAVYISPGEGGIILEVGKPRLEVDEQYYNMSLVRPVTE